MIPEVKVIALSDIHFGHKKCYTEHMVSSMNKWFRENMSVIAQADLFVITGDIFDSLFYLPQKDTLLVLMWMRDVQHICRQNDVILVVLDGTDSHDRKQSAIFEALIPRDDTLLYYYMDTLSILELPTLDMNIMCVPDEWSDNPEDTAVEARDLLARYGLVKADLILMHGAFPHQLPDIPGIDFHDPEAYISMTNTYVINGHVHKYQVYKDTLVSPNSFDRICHGEEDDKGGLHLTLRNSGKSEHTRLINHNAMDFRTLKLGGDTVINSMLIDKLTGDLSPGSHIRIKATVEILKTIDVVTLTRTYGAFYFTLLRSDKVKRKTIAPKLKMYQSAPLHKDNISSMVEDYLVAHGISIEEADRATELLKEYL